MTKNSKPADFDLQETRMVLTRLLIREKVKQTKLLSGSIMLTVEKLVGVVAIWVRMTLSAK